MIIFIFFELITYYSTLYLYLYLYRDYSGALLHSDEEFMREIILISTK